MYLEEVIAMHECETMTGVSKQEEAETIVIHHAVEVASNRMNVQIYPQDTDVLFLALRRTPLLGDYSAAIMGTTERRRNVFIHAVYDKLGSRRFSFRGNNVICTELPVCKCGGVGDNCTNITQPMI